MKKFGKTDYCWCPRCGTLAILKNDKIEWLTPENNKEKKWAIQHHIMEY